MCLKDYIILEGFEPYYVALVFIVRLFRALIKTGLEFKIWNYFNTTLNELNLREGTMSLRWKSTETSVTETTQEEDENE